ncbi:unnamed protein product [Danaus chrysippus]|uniref:(African queen) hypothetical protein n=1 Tax=Danaus chrysippus TaxID=151541 RepID=A0A8J2R4L0_9NEOP|nr:unnamed protein product [Danaus chrysippus]
MYTRALCSAAAGGRLDVRRGHSRQTAWVSRRGEARGATSEEEKPLRKEVNVSAMDGTNKVRVKRQSGAGKYTEAAKMPKVKQMRLFLQLFKNFWDAAYIGGSHPFHPNIPKAAIALYKQKIVEFFVPDVFLLLLCAVASTTASHAVAWPGAIPVTRTHVKTIIPAQIDSIGYSTSQYINAVPPQLAHQQHFGYQIALPGYHPYQPVISPSYIPSNSFLYPSFAPVVPQVPSVPVQPPQPAPSRPSEQPQGDEDSAVVDSADFPPSQQQPSSDMPQSQQPQPPSQNNPSQSLDSKNMPAISQIPQYPVPFPQYPGQNSQFPGQLPSFPQIPQIGSNFPQLPQFPQLPMNPLFPQPPSSSAPSFPSTDSGAQSNNDEDSVSVDAA